MTNISINELIITKIPLRFRENGKFRILMISDIHNSPDTTDEVLAMNADAIDTVIAETDPDLVLIAGDISSQSEKDGAPMSDMLKHHLDAVTAPMEKRGIPWAHVFGNHDVTDDYPTSEQISVYTSYPHCLTKAGPDGIDGVGNYVLPVFDHEGKKILFNVFGLDSHQSVRRYFGELGREQEKEYYHMTPCTNGSTDGVHFNQIMWYYRVSEALEEYNGEKIPALMYMHNPIPEHALMAERRWPLLYDGSQFETIACSPINYGLFGACIGRGDVKAIFSGHDHVNDYVGHYCGITIGYDGFLSYSGYGREETCGGRLFDIDASDPWAFTTKMVYLRDLKKNDKSKKER